ncbi:hypothetical protein HXY32_03370 [Candidatus Bathyarchaeota archaeon]|nr:hypothetical protein [Candidatus Bathyarchaeota archaeon]
MRLQIEKSIFSRICRIWHNVTYCSVNDDFYRATAKTSNEAKERIESGFEYVCTTPEDIMLLRKRK